MLRKFAALRNRLPINLNFANSLATGYGLIGLMIVIQLTLIPLYLTYLGKERFGILAMIMAATTYAAVGIGWLSGGMARIMAECAAVEDIKGFKVAYAFAKWLYVGYALIIVLIFWLLAPRLLARVFEDNETLIALFLASIYIILLYEYSADRLAFNARHWQAKGNLGETIGQIVFVALVLIALWADLGLPGVIASQIAGILTTRTFAYYFWRQDSWQPIWMKPSQDFKYLWERISGKMGRDYAICGALILTLRADVLLLGWLLNPDAAASYYLLWRIPEIIILLLSQIPGSYSPFLIAMDARGEHQAIKKGYKRGLYLMIGLSSLAAIIYGSAGPSLLTAWLGESAPEGYLPYLMAACAMFFLGVACWPSGVAYSLMNTKPLNCILGVELIFKLVLLVMLYTKFGYFSTTVATLISYSLIIGYLFLWLGKNSISVGRVQN